MTAEATTRIETDRKYRLITRADMDGLVCAVILKELDLIDDIVFAHPKDMQDGKVPVTDRDITTNLPYVEGVYMCFDHHASETTRMANRPHNHHIDASEPSAARVVYKYFDGDKNAKLKNISEDMMSAVDKADSASFTREEILNPQGWVLLSFIMDARTGLGRFRDFGISNHQLMMSLIDHCRQHHSIDDILALPDVKERVDLYESHMTRFRQQIERCAKLEKNVIVLDLRDEENIWAGNRFVIYALFPQCNISMHVMWGRNRQNTVIAVGKSILNKTNKNHVGNLMLEYGGGGHAAAGTCQVDNDQADEIIGKIVTRLNADA